MRTELAAYTAGILDGEGSIQINPSKGSGGRRYWCLTIRVSNNDIAAIQSVRDDWGFGSVNAWPAANGRQHGYWAIYSGNAKELLEAVSPYLRIKRAHAAVALEFLAVASSRFAKLTTAQLVRRAELAAAMAKLNAKSTRCAEKTPKVGVL